MTTNLKITNLTAIEIEIEKLRHKLIMSGIENGLSHPTTIELSQQLDDLLNEYKSN
jgi:hypothetical protein